MTSTASHHLQLRIIAGDLPGTPGRAQALALNVALSHPRPEGRSACLGGPGFQGMQGGAIEQTTSAPGLGDQTAFKIGVRWPRNSGRRSEACAEHQHGGPASRLLESSDHGPTLCVPTLRFGFRLRLSQC